MTDVNGFDMYVCFRDSENKTWGRNTSRNIEMLLHAPNYSLNLLSRKTSQILHTAHKVLPQLPISWVMDKDE